jgi:hypothetical protein
MAGESAPDKASTRRPILRAGLIAILGLAAYLVLAYGLLPKWAAKRAERGPADFSDSERITHTASGIPGDPLNLALVGSEEEVIRAMLAAAWHPADPLTFHSSVRIAVDTVFNKPDPRAPVSNLFLYGRKEDLAFEKPVGHSPRQRHHVRFWRGAQHEGGRPVWMGAATHDMGVEISRTTAEVTHRISPDVDSERDLLADDLAKGGGVQGRRWIDGFHREREGRNGGGDPWRTDGRLLVIELSGSAP